MVIRPKVLLIFEEVQVGELAETFNFQVIPFYEAIEVVFWADDSEVVFINEFKTAGKHQGRFF